MLFISDEIEASFLEGEGPTLIEVYDFAASLKVQTHSSAIA